MYKFIFADIGEGLHEGTVGEIYKNVGDAVKEGDSLFSVETDKVVSDIPSPVTGTITKVLMEVGEVIHVGNEIYYIDDNSGDDATPNVEEQPKEEEVESAGASVVGEVKVSNDVIDFSNMFGQSPTPSPEPVQPLVEEIQTVKQEINNQLNIPTTTASSDNHLDTLDIDKGEFDYRSIEAIGNGEKVDVVVIGAGPGGYTAGEFLSKAGLKTIVVEKAKAGGVCLNVGCIPTKALLKSAKLLDKINHAKEMGIDVPKGSKLNWKKMQSRKNKVSKTLSQGVEMLIKGAKATYVKGKAKVIDKHNVQVGDKLYTTKLLVIATGSSPIMIPIDGLKEGIDSGIIIDSTDALSLKEIPKTLTIVGGGVIGVEFAVLYAELGTKVTILEGMDSILMPMDGEVKIVAKKMLIEKGIEIKTNVRVVGWSKSKGTIYEEDGIQQSIKGQKVLLSVGRRANNLKLDKVLGLELTRGGGINVNANMQTNIPNVFAIGDVINDVMLAHTAYKHAHVLVSFIKGYQLKYNSNIIPAAVYTYPEISMIGKTEEQLKEEGIEYGKAVWQNKYVGKIVADGDDEIGFTKILYGKKFGEILGAHIVNQHSSDMIAEIAAVMELEGTVFELANTIHPHPSISESIYETAVLAKENILKSK